MNEFEWTLQLRFIIALALGFLIGLERENSRVEKTKRLYAGVRTHALISLFGFGCGWMAQIQTPLALPVGLLSVAALCVVSYLAKTKEGRVGWTSEIAALLTFVMGALCVLSDIWLPASLGVISTLLLSEKAEIERHVERLNKSEFLAITRFLLVTIIILPLLPNENYTQFHLNPARIWKIVIMVSTIGFVGYFLSKKFGDQMGLWLSGLLGGIVSSTAVSVAVGRLAQKKPERGREALQASLIAGSVMYLRILILIWIINPAFVAPLWQRLVFLSFIGLVLALSLKTSDSPSVHTPISTLQNPFEIVPALLFAFLFVALSIITVLVKQSFSERGLLALSVIVGATDIDPFLLSLVNGEAPVSSVMIAAIMIAMMSNTFMKGLYFGSLAKETRHMTYWRYGLWTLLHLPLVFLY
ncbi:MAG: DUF4010 domain-containing protein [Candidatus Omnitrophota bacterium]|jgi:uncharacterized membrane protein (DUF4010 family)|nr:MAG: DUF4010 domain-containing protein [Candidatus Omnitrophota bacterium]